MRAFTIIAPHAGEVRDVPMPEAGPAEVIVEVAFCGVCGTDYHIFRGDLLAAGRVDVKPLLSDVAGLGDLAAILGRAKTPAELKTLISPSKG